MSVDWSGEERGEEEEEEAAGQKIDGPLQRGPAAAERHQRQSSCHPMVVVVVCWGNGTVEKKRGRTRTSWNGPVRVAHVLAVSDKLGRYIGKHRSVLASVAAVQTGRALGEVACNFSPLFIVILRYVSPFLVVVFFAPCCSITGQSNQ